MPIIHKAKRDDNPDTKIREAPQTEYVRYLIGKYWVWAVALAVMGYCIYWIFIVPTTWSSWPENTQPSSSVYLYHLNYLCFVLEVTFSKKLKDIADTFIRTNREGYDEVIGNSGWGGSSRIFIIDGNRETYTDTSLVKWIRTILQKIR